MIWGSSNWTDERVEELRRLWAAEPRLSCSEIGRELGITRNAVIGKVNRLGLEHRPNPTKSRRVAGPRRRHIPPRPHNPNPEPPRFDLGAICDLPPDKSEHAVDLFDIGPDQCRYTVQDRPHLFCGAPGYPWCPRHTTICTTRNGRADLARETSVAA